MHFEDRYKNYDYVGYVATNEDAQLHRELVGRRRFKQAGVIASGGEVVLQLLPRCEAMVAIDHSYRSLFWTAMKMHLLRTLGPTKTRKLFLGEHSRITETVWAEMSQIPQDLVAALKYYSRDFFIQKNIYEYPQLRKEWYFFSVARLRQVVPLLDRVQLIHGDFRDLQSFGEFDLLYISNASQHSNRLSKTLTLKSLEPFLRPGGLVLVTGRTPVEPGFQKVRNILGYRSSWDHQLIQREAPKRVRIKKAPATNA